MGSTSSPPATYHCIGHQSLHPSVVNCGIDLSRWLRLRHNRRLTSPPPRCQLQRNDVHLKEPQEMVFGVARGPPVDEGDLERFVEAVSSLRAEEWQKRVAALRELVDAVPDYSSSPQTERGEVDATATPSSRPSNGGGGAGGGPHKPRTIPWYRSSKAVRRLATPLRGLLLDARSAVVKEAAELVGTLLIVKLQPRPEALVAGGDAAGTDDGGADGGGNGGAGGPLETIDGGGGAARRRVAGPPPPAFVGRLLLKDLLPAVLDLSKQTVKVIRTYGTAMMLDVLPHCRVKSILVVLLERMKTHRNRTLREDCARCVRRSLCERAPPRWPRTRRTAGKTFVCIGRRGSWTRRSASGVTAGRKRSFRRPRIGPARRFAAVGHARWRPREARICCVPKTRGRPRARRGSGSSEEAASRDIAIFVAGPRPLGG